MQDKQLSSKTHAKCIFCILSAVITLFSSNAMHSSALHVNPKQFITLSVDIFISTSAQRARLKVRPISRLEKIKIRTVVIFIFLGVLRIFNSYLIPFCMQFRGFFLQWPSSNHSPEIHCIFRVKRGTSKQLDPRFS